MSYLLILSLVIFLGSYLQDRIVVWSYNISLISFLMFSNEHLISYLLLKSFIVLGLLGTLLRVVSLIFNYKKMDYALFISFFTIAYFTKNVVDFLNYDIDYRFYFLSLLLVFLNRSKTAFLHIILYLLMVTWIDGHVSDIITFSVVSLTFLLLETSHPKHINYEKLKTINKLFYLFMWCLALLLPFSILHGFSFSHRNEYLLVLPFFTLLFDILFKKVSLFNNIL